MLNVNVAVEPGVGDELDRRLQRVDRKLDELLARGEDSFELQVVFDKVVRLTKRLERLDARTPPSDPKEKT